MDCKETREILFRSSSNDAPAHKQKQVREHLATCRTCQTALARLATEIKQWGQTCAAVQEMLPIYVEDELAAKPVQTLYPHVWQHLGECSSCTRAYDDLRDLLQLEREGRWIEPPTYPSLALPFVRSDSPASRSQSWTIKMLSETQGRLSAIITISKAYIKTVIFPQPLAGARSAENLGPLPTQFPLLDSLLEDSSWLVSVEILRERVAPPSPQRWHLKVSLAGPTSPGRIQVRIANGGEERRAVMNEKGEAFFPDVPLIWLPAGDGDPTDDGLEIQIQQIEL